MVAPVAIWTKHRPLNKNVNEEFGGTMAEQQPGISTGPSPRNADVDRIWFAMVAPVTIWTKP